MTRTEKTSLKARATSAKKSAKLPSALVGRPTFDVRNVRANNRELGVWLAWMAVTNNLVAQRSILTARFHEAQSFDKEAPPLETYYNRNMRIVDRAWRDGNGTSDEIKLLEIHLRAIQDYGNFVSATSHGAAQNFVYTIDSLIKYAATFAKIAPGDKDKNIIGGRYLTQNVTLLEGFRIVANWQRHHLEWDDKKFNENNYNHRGLKEMGLWRNRNTSVAFLKLLKRRTYFALERDINDALEYLVCEMGMNHPKLTNEEPNATK